MATSTSPNKPANKKNTKGRDARKKTKIARAHQPDLNRFYTYNLPPLTPGVFTFHVDLLRQGVTDPFPLDTMLESLTWQDEAASLSGSMTLYRPDPTDPLTVPVLRGDQVRCRVTWGDKQKFDLWTMRTSAPQIQVDQGVVTVGLTDDLILLSANDQDWIFRKTKGRPQGYTAADITRLVAKQLGLPVGELAPATVKMSMVKRNASAKDVITAAWAKEKAKTGRSYILRLYNGAIEVITIQPNPTIYVLAKQIQTALISQKGGAKTPTTVLTGIARVGKGKDAKKITYTAFDRKVVDLLGHVPQTKHYGRVDSAKQLRDDVNRDLAAQLKLPDTVTIDTPGIPFILRGDSAQVKLPAEGYSGQNSLVYCQSGDHTVADGQYTTEFVFGFTNPIVAAINAAAKAAAAAAAAKAGKSGSRNQPTNSSSGDKWLVTASAESDGGTGACRVIQPRGYSELSTDPTGSLDFAALGHIPCLTEMIITNPANGKSVTVQKQDVGAGSSFLPVMGIYPQSVVDLGLSGGEFHVHIQRADGGALTPVRGTKIS